MARQVGPHFITGTLGNLIYYKNGDRYYVKLKTHVDPKRLVKGPGYELQRGRMLEFGQAAKAGKLIYLAFASSCHQAKEPNLNAHLQRDLLKVIKSDKLNECGRRNVTDGETALLEGFDFNENAMLSKVFLAPFTSFINRRTGFLSVIVPPFNPQKMIKGPAHATHFMIQAAGAELDFTHHQHGQAVTQGIELPLLGTLTDPLTLQIQVAPNSPHPILLALRITFLQEFNGTIKPLKSINHNAMALVKVCGI